MRLTAIPQVWSTDRRVLGRGRIPSPSLLPTLGPISPIHSFLMSCHVTYPVMSRFVVWCRAVQGRARKAHGSEQRADVDAILSILKNLPTSLKAVRQIKRYSV